ncbi:hypothetical protein [Mycolicibacter virginiensis]|uniref:hypothetical protein n=1 Tax=Mycolicibacter virginiensis TaxID=1795032 RepID=UPI001F046A6E|nr:hypothetical protein [Mycolicibacter virginiensis]ULP48064.1 hypothetical protein MJO54_02510 [Mycolicibacter virginiensis]
MKILKQIRGAPRWARVTLAAVWILALVTGLVISGQLALDASYQRGFEAGVSAPAPAPATGPQLPEWLPAGADRTAALEAMERGVPFVVESRDEGFGCVARLMLLPDGRLWWLQHPESGGRELTWEVGRWGLPHMGCDSEQLRPAKGGGR